MILAGSFVWQAQWWPALYWIGAAAVTFAAWGMAR